MFGTAFRARRLSARHRILGKARIHQYAFVPDMKLEQITIKNFRLLADATIRTSEHTATTILVGPNNSGKTSVMQAIEAFVSQRADALSFYDFSVGVLSEIDSAEALAAKAANDTDAIRLLQKNLPHIEVEFRFSYEDTPADLNLVQPLLMGLSPQDQVILRARYAIGKANRLWEDFRDRRKPEETLLREVIKKSIESYYEHACFKVSPDGTAEERLPEKDKLIIKRLIRLNMVPAQRYVDDHEGSRAAKLSQLLHTHYQAYVQKAKPEVSEQVDDAVADSAKELTNQYAKGFAPLLDELQGFGYPQGAAKPDLKITAEMTAETLYKDTTRIYYSAPGEPGTPDGQLDPDWPLLPERLNGLGYKNLIYIVLQLHSFKAALQVGDQEAPGVHLVGIEEPEAHLHPQMQAVFLSEVNRVLNWEGGQRSQALLSTHSPHIVADSGFLPIRHFRKQGSAASVSDLSRLRDAIDDDGPDETLKFLARYVQLTHCDLFFADKAILVEGRVEKLLLPAMIQQVAKQDGLAHLARQYITTLEVGGAYAHKLRPLLKFLSLPALVIADIDSAERVTNDNGKKVTRKCRVSDGDVSTNAVLKSFFPGAVTLDDFVSMTSEEKVVELVRVAFQTAEENCHGRSFEESFIYSNLDWVERHVEDFTESRPEIAEAVQAGLQASAYDLGQVLPKVSFALDIMSTEGWTTPHYIQEGLVWLASAGSTP